VSLRDTEQLVPIRFTDILGAAGLMCVLYAFGGFLVVWLWKMPDRLGFFSIFFVLRVSMAFLLTELFLYDDERIFHLIGLGQIDELFSSESGKGYDYIVNILYTVLGPNIFLPKIVNAFIGALLPFLVYDITQRIFHDPSKSRRSLLCTGLIPPLVVFSALNLKEIATGFLLVLTLWFITTRQAITYRMSGSAISILILYWLRGTVWALIPFSGSVIWFLYGRCAWAASLWGERTVRRIVLVSVFLVIGILLSLDQSILEVVGHRLTEEAYFIERFTTSEAGVMQYIDVEDPLAPKNFVVLFLRGLFSPSPLRFLFDYGLDTLVESLNMLTWYLLFPLAAVGFFTERKNRKVLACSIMVIGVLTISFTGLIFGGDPYRHRITAFGLIIALASGGLDMITIRKYRWILYCWWVGGVVFTGLWLVMRIEG
jgi:hypothetical protein